MDEENRPEHPEGRAGPSPSDDDTWYSLPLGDPRRPIAPESAAPSADPYVNVPRNGGGGPRRAIAIGVGIALLAGGVAFAAGQMGDDGPGSPEAAVDALFAALEDEDVIGMLEALPASERRVLIDPVRELTDELHRLGVVDTVDLRDVAGFDFEVDGLDYQVTELTEGIASVHVVGGTVTAELIGDAVPVGPSVEQIAEDLDAPLEIPSERDVTRIAPDDDVRLVAIEDGGSWHVSLGYSIAEVARRDAGAPLPDFDVGVEPVGADSPADAVRALAEAAAELDLRTVIGLLPPDEMAALYDYAPLFLSDVEELVRDSAAPRVHIDELDLGETTTGDSGTVTIRSFSGSIDIFGETMEVDYDGTCTTIGVEGTTDKTCPEDTEEVLGAFGLGSIAAGMPTQSTIQVVRVDGEWYVSPIRTGAEMLLGLLRALDDDALPRIAKDITGAVGRFEEDPAALDDALSGTGLFGEGVGEAIGSGAAVAGEVPTMEQLVLASESFLDLEPDQARCAAEAFVQTFDPGELSLLYVALVERADDPPPGIGDDVIDILMRCTHG